MTDLPDPPTPPLPPSPPSYPGAVPTYTGGHETAAPDLDGVSVASFVAAATCCGAPLAIVLGIIGLRRTRNRQRTGRWAAVTGIVLGAVGSLLLVPLVGGISFLVGTSVDDMDPAEARPGQCIDLDYFDWPEEVSCAGPHEGEIVWAGKVTRSLADEWREAEYIEDFCLNRPMSRAHEAAYEDDEYLLIDYWVDGWDWDASQGEFMFCYLTPDEGVLDLPVGTRAT